MRMPQEKAQPTEESRVSGIGGGRRAFVWSFRQRRGDPRRAEPAPAARPLPDASRDPVATAKHRLRLHIQEAERVRVDRLNRWLERATRLPSGSPSR